MVCGRCIKSVTSVFERNGVNPESVQLGEVKLKENINRELKQKIREQLSAEGFVLLDDQKAKLVDQVKRAIADLVHYGELDEMNRNLSSYLADKLQKDYHYLSSLFSSISVTKSPDFITKQQNDN